MGPFPLKQLTLISSSNPFLVLFIGGPKESTNLTSMLNTYFVNFNYNINMSLYHIIAYEQRRVES